MTKKNSSDCHCIHIRRASNAVTKYYDSVLKKDGLTLNQYSILCNIQSIEPCSVAGLARTVRLERTTLVRNLKPLFSSGLIQDDAPAGNRKTQIHLTNAGREKLSYAKKEWEHAQTHLEDYMGRDVLQTLTECLLKLERINE